MTRSTALRSYARVVPWPLARVSASQAGDAALVLAVVVVQASSVTTGRGGSVGELLPGVVTALGVAQGLLLVVRRRRPGTVALAVTGLYAAQAALAGVVLPAAAWVALSGLVPARAWAALAVALVVLGTGLAGGAAARPSSAGTIPLLVAVTAVLLLAVAVRAARRDRADAVTARREAEARRRASEERLSLARELHDSIGHGLSVVAVQSSAARMALQAGDGGTAVRSLAAAEESGRAALRELRHLVAVLRDPGAGTGLTAGLEDLPDILRRTRAAGVTATLSMPDDLGDPPVAVQATIHRIVQEGLTNVVRHAPGAWARVEVARRAGDVVVTVEDGGSRPPGRPSGGGPEGAGPGSGFGLVGLAERLELLGGTLAARPSESGAGWVLVACMPLDPGGGDP